MTTSGRRLPTPPSVVAVAVAAAHAAPRVGPAAADRRRAGAGP